MAKLVLELELEPELIEKITNAAKASNETVAQYAERLFRDNVEFDENDRQAETGSDLPAWIRELTIAKTPTPNFDHKQVYGDYIMEKYSV